MVIFEKMNNKLITFLIPISCLYFYACSEINNNIQMHNIVGEWKTLSIKISDSKGTTIKYKSDTLKALGWGSSVISTTVEDAYKFAFYEDSTCSYTIPGFGFSGKWKYNSDKNIIEIIDREGASNFIKFRFYDINKARIEFLSIKKEKELNPSIEFDILNVGIKRK